jgi:uncharacterized membrane protein YuzA (DUF378 family)
MSKLLIFIAWLAAVLAGIATFNLLIGVFGLNQAIVTLVVFVIFAIYTCLRTQFESKSASSKDAALS